MTTRFRLFIILLFSVLTNSIMAQEDPGYYFTNYSVEATVHEDNVISVTEKIDAYFTLESHGIYRIIPTWVWVNRDVSEQQDGSKTKMMHYQCNVSNIETSEEWTELEDEDTDMLVMRFGVFEKTYTGPHSYTIKYDLNISGDRIDVGDAFFYSLLGEGWDCPTQHFSFKVHFDKALSSDELGKMQLFTGKLGSNENVRDKYIKVATSNEISGELSNIEPRSAVTLFVPLQNGYFSNCVGSTTEQKASQMGAIVCGLLFFFLILKFLNTKKDIVTKAITFYPPKNCSSAEVGTLIDCSVDDRDLISLIPWFAQQGYISIDNTGKNPILRKLKPLPGSAPNYQQTLFNGFFHGENTAFDMGSIGTSFAKSWLSAKETATNSFKDKLNNVSWGKMLLIFIAILATSVFNYLYINDNDGWIMALSTLGCFSFFSFFMLEIGDDSTTKAVKVFFGLLAIGAIGLFFLILSEMTERDDATYIAKEIIYAINFGLVIVCFFAKQMTFMTKYRRERIGEILGLQEFISTAEKQQLEHLQEEDEKYYYNILPYAVAFGMAKSWAKKFDGITVPPVDWYKGDSSTPMTYGLSDMATSNAVNEKLQQAVQKELAARQEAISRASGGSSHSSASTFGGGGGGFSGGGFGGGGGGRW